MFSRQRTSPHALSPTEVCELLGVSRSTVDALMNRGELPSLKVGKVRRILRRDLDAYMSRVRTAAPQTTQAAR